MKGFSSAAVGMVGLLLALGLVGGAASAEARELRWSSMHVTARLDADGVLHVVERQAMVFTGDWNGGERGFRLGGGQKIELERLTRIDPASGARVELVEGDLDRIDHFDWVSGDKLRWRSRLPSEPRFEETTLVYLLEYRLSGILVESADLYRLDHDFAFPDRPGSIESFVLDLQLDPVWVPPETLPVHLEKAHVPPGLGVVLTADLAYTGEGRPGQVQRRVPRSWILGIFLAVLAGLALKSALFWRNEAAQGRYETVELPPDLDAAWLEEHLLGLLPEEAGALWDRSVGAPEVAAVLARMVGEGKLASATRTTGGFVGRPVLELELQVDRTDLEGYERKLIDKLFFGDRTSTDTEAIRKHYKSTGFRPVKEIAKPIEKRLKKIAGLGEELPKPGPGPTRWLLLAFVALFALEVVGTGWVALGLLVGLFMTALLPAAMAYGFAGTYAKRIQHPHAASAGFFLPLLVVVGGTGLLAGVGGILALDGGGTALGLPGILAAACFALALVNSVLNAALTRESRTAVRARKILAAARRRFREELRKPEPRIRDEWFPYLMAFGLQGQVDRWFRSFGGGISATASVGGSSSGSGTGSGGRPLFTGGGGSFGGGGASSTWAAAATGLGAGVSPPGSSSSGGGGGGGGSSGGGSGGGW